jgi:UDP-N-acetylglucosamine/UDP-N-acetylgalactosamine diphosphorylase
MSTLDTLRARLEPVGQSHVLKFWETLDPAQRDALTNQIESIDWAALPRLVEQYVRNKPVFALPPDVQPAPYLPVDPGAKPRPWDKAAAKAKGEQMLRAGQVAAFVVAGGQGSRLGYEGPKGCYPAGAVTGKPLFAMFADAILGAYDRYGVHVPWYIMTSPLNHDATLEFFAAHHFFGLPRESVRFFMQGVMPSLDIATGRVLLASRGEIATNPDGHGGSLRALHASGSLSDMKQRGVTAISYFQVDNPIVNLLDPVFLGLHAGAGGAVAPSSAQMSSKMIPKAYAEEKLGLFCAHGSGPRKGRVEIVEYSDLPMDLQREKLPDGRLRFLAGSIAVHVLGREFVERLNTDAAFELPWHRAEKKIPCIDPATGEPVRPAANNGVKLERFVFDALPMCEHSVVLETDRVEEFAPIKNAEGQDSPQSSRQIQTERAARWLEWCGVAVPRKADGAPDCVLEISARTASTREELKAGAGLPRAIERGQRLAL